ncbi:MAG: molybdopterin-dependent oxidoreductase, partial [Nevskia sp.]|nr:molybdopterin-dependent oxidoreductase [Nevskia sp.]
TALAVGKVRYVGDCVAAVAAIDEETALAALRLIEVEYEELPAYLTPEAGLRGVREKIYDHCPGDSNIHKAVEQAFGDVDAALAGCEYTVTRDCSFVGVNHGFTEPHAVVAHYDSRGRLTVWSAQQVPHYLHRALADVLEMPMHRVRVIRPMVGGGFGGKSDPFPHEMIAALLARKSGRPVKILFDREEVFLTNHGRHPTKQKVTIGLDAGGLIQALDIRALIDGGAWASFGVVTTYYNGVLAQGPYYVPNFRYQGARVYTNKAPCGAMRAHGAVNTRYAVEVALDILAEQAGIDPCELRLRNALPAFSVLPNGFRITSNGFKECIERVRAASDWDRQFRRLPPGEGIGLGCGFYISGSALPIHRSRLPQSTVHIKIDMDGGVTVHSGAAEIGQGSDTVLALCVAEVLGVRLERIRVFSQDSDLAPIDLGSYSSRVTFMAGNAARRAALAIRRQLVAAAARLTGYNDENVFVCRDEMIHNTANPDRSVSFMQALEEALADSGALIAKGMYQSPPLGGTFKGATAGLSPSYSFNAYIARVSVDTETGFIRVRKVWAAHDCGQALNPVAVEGQIEGSIHMGLGQVLSEAMTYKGGHILAPNLLDYKILGPLEMPEVEVHIVESHDPEGPFGAKEAGEGPLIPILPAVANAVYDAVGVRLYDLPLTPDRVLTALELKAKGKTYEDVRVPVL